MKKKFFAIARIISQKSTHKFKLGCVIVQKNRIVAVGFNRADKTHPKSPTPRHTIHAELDALIGLDTAFLKGSVCYVYRERKDGSLGCAKPCHFCQQAIARAGIRRVYYSDYDGFKELHLV